MPLNIWIEEPDIHIMNAWMVGGKLNFHLTCLFAFIYTAHIPASAQTLLGLMRRPMPS